MYRGWLDLAYENKEEEAKFRTTTRIGGHHIAMVKHCYELDAYQILMGGNWNKPEPGGRGRVGNFGMALRYATINPVYREYAVEKGRFTSDEVDSWFREWGERSRMPLPLDQQEILDFYRSNRKEKKRRDADNLGKRYRRRTKTFERKFAAERDPARIFNALKRTIPSRSAIDDQLLRHFSRYLAQSNDLLFQAERLKDADDGTVAMENIADYNKILDLGFKINKQINDLLKQHGYDYQARRKRRETMTAAEIFEDFKDEAAVMFEQRAIELICTECQLSFGYFIRHFPTVEYRFEIPRCPRCEESLQQVFESMPDEVMNA